MAVLVAAVAPPRKETTVELVDQEKKQAEVKLARTGITVFFVVVVFAFIVAIVVRYFI